MGNKLHGILAEFDSATELVDAARKVRDAGYTKVALVGLELPAE